MGILVTATSAVYAIVAGFFIADAMSNYLRLQTLISEENAALSAIADYAKRIDEQRAPAVHRAIDEYIIAQLDANTLNHILKTETQTDALQAAVNALEIKREDSEPFERLLEMKEKVLTSRQEILFAAKKNLTFGHWATLITLGVLVALTVLAIRDGGTFMNVISGAMIAGMYAIAVLLRDMDNNRLLEIKVGFDTVREVFHTLAVPPYYPSYTSAKERVPDRNGQYRVRRENSTGQDAYEIITVN